ncbi:MAG TPA: PmoA family protein [Bryobacteraceae bacterium]|nr:PmoA family protein [Bryobacteraceae bacterium]
MKLALIVSISLALPLVAEVKMTRGQDRVDVSIDGKPFTTFYYGAEGNKPYLHPLRSVKGTIVTRRYPMEEVAGESRDHKHHRGLWFTHGDVNGVDFWANDPVYAGRGKLGKVVLEKLVRAQGGAKSGLIEADFNWNDPDGRTLLKEHRRMTFIEDPVNRIVDFDVTLTAVEKVTFGDTKEGTFAVRIADEMTEKNRGGQMKNASGAASMRNVWGKQSPWVDYAGTVQGEKVGIAIFDHPQNPKHPTFWHTRDYGLHAANIFGEHDFFNDKSRNGSVTLEPGKSMRFRYRVLIHPGDSDAANIQKLYGEYKGGAGS